MPRSLSALAGLLLAVPALAADPLPIRVERDIVYGTGGGVELQLDIAYPTRGGPYPAVLCLHGGGWRVGNRQELSKANLVFPGTSMIERIAERGYVAASATYRLAPKAKWPAQIEDAKAAVRFLRASAKDYPLDPDRIAALGVSAGGHLACMLGVTEPDDGFEGNGGRPEVSSRVQAVVSVFGPTDFTLKTWSPLAEDVAYIPLFGVKFDADPRLYRRASPVDHVRRGAPPFLFFHGTADPIVDLQQTHRLADNLSEVGTKVRVLEMPGEGHGWLGTKAARSVGQLVDWLDGVLK